MAMPWKRAKAKAAAIRADETGASLERLNRLFNACFRIQAEASLAAGHRIPLVLENVRGAIPWVGRSRYNFGSFHLWGDVPALMPAAIRAQKVPGFRFDGSGKSFQTASVHETGFKSQGLNWSDQTKRRQDFTRHAGQHCGVKVPSTTGRSPAPGSGARFTSRDCGIEVAEGRKGAGAGAEWFDQNLCALSSKSPSRKFASAMIAKIPLPLSQYVARTFRPR